MPARTLPLLLAVLAPLAPVPGQRTPAQPAKRSADAPAPPPALGEAATARVVDTFTRADTWAMRAIVLMSLGRDWHPAGAGAVLAALRDRDQRLPCYAIELLRGMDREALRKVATPELVGELLLAAHHHNKLLAERTVEVLTRIAPAGVGDRDGLDRWWREAAATYAPPAWTPPATPPAAAGGTAAVSVVERAFDLEDAGLDVALVVDSTGSMQVAIDTARDAIDDVVTILAGIAPKLRLGLVHYKDVSDMSEGAKLLVAMTKNQKAVREKLAKLVAGGGGDVPENIERGVAVALDRAMGWNKEANRLILVIGDAPAHPEDEQALLTLVREAHDHPFTNNGKNPVTGVAKENVRPFITSLIATNPMVQEEFAKVAAAGGGAAVVLDAPAAPPPPPLRGKPAAAPAVAPSSPAVQRIVGHILALSFGEEHRAQLERFAAIFFEYRDAKLFK